MKRIRKAGTLLIILFSNPNANGYMGKSAPSAPAAPDPAATGAAQTASNKETALYQFGLNNPNYNTPLGNLSYSVDQTDPNKPQTTANVSLSPGQQQLYDQNTAQSVGLSNLAGDLQSRVGNTLNQPLPSSGDYATTEKNAQDAYYKNQTQFLDPQFAQGQEQLDAKLANQGITMGSEAYNNDQNNFARQKQSAYDTAQQNAILQGPQNAQQLFALSSAARNQPLNEFNALRSQSQVQMPSFNATQPTTVAPTNTAQIAQNAYMGQQNAYNQQIASNNSTTGGLFGLGGNALMAASMFSDIRLKENIKYIGHEKGIPVYTWIYIGDKQRKTYRGTIAQAIIGTHPNAVVLDGEYYAVNYGILGIEFGRIH